MFIDSGGFWSAFHGGIRRGGAFELKQATWAYRHALLSPNTASDPARREALEAVDLIDWFRDMPWSPGHSPLAAAPEYEAYLFEQWREGCFTDYWKRPGLCADGFYDAIPDVPVAIVGSWYDPYVTTCTRNFAELAARKRSTTTLLMGPWTHGDRSATFAGEVDFGDQSTLDGNIAPDYLSLRLDWFERWLKPGSGTPRPIEPPVTYFQMGGGPGGVEGGRLRHGGRWRRCSTWPPPEASVRSLYLHRDGKLDDAAPVASPDFVEYCFDPRDPVPTVGGALTSGDPVMAGGAFDQRVGPATFTYRAGHPAGPLAGRGDVVCFQTDPLAGDLVVTGEIVAELWVSTDCPDTDFTVKLVDVYPPGGEQLPQGFAMNVTDGIFRLRYREGWDREVPAEPGRVYRIRIRPFATSNLFRRGHRLRVDISSSNYPHFDINPNTGGRQGYADEPRVATNRIHFDAEHPSRILLPVMPAAAGDRDGD